MPESLRDLVVSLSLNTDNFTRNIKSVTRQIQEAESRFKLAGAGTTGFETSAAGIAARLTSLRDKLVLQKAIVEQYERALAQANARLQETHGRYQEYSQRLDEAKQKHQELGQAIVEQEAHLKNIADLCGTDCDAYREESEVLAGLKKEYMASGEEVKRLSGQCEALRKSTQNAADAVSVAQTHLNQARAAVKETTAEIERSSKQLKVASSSWTAMGKALDSFHKRCEKVGSALTGIGRKMTRYITTPIVGLGTAALKADIEFESAFTSVRKTVDASEAEFGELADSVKQMSTEIAADTTTIAETMAIAGQLGIQNEALEDFTRVMIDLSNSTNMQAEEAASQAARFANIMGMNQDQFTNLGSTLVDLGNNYATTESEIMAMSMRLAGAGKQVGLTEAQILGFAAALSSVGIEAQMGGSAFSKALIKMEVAAATGSSALDDFAGVAGMTADEFKTVWDADPGAAFQAFIVGLSQMDEEGISAIATLEEIGIKEVRLRDTLLRATNATQLFSATQDTANRAWKQNTALSVESGKRYATLESRLVNLKNKAVLFAQTLGNDLRPMLERLMEGVSGFIDRLSGMDEASRQRLISIATTVAAIGPAILILGKLTSGLGKVTNGLGIFATAVGKAGGGFGGFLSVLAKSPAVWLALAAGVTFGVVKLLDWASGAKKAREATQQLIDTAKDWKDTAAETFYTSDNAGLSFFGMSEKSFTNNDAQKNARDWLSGLIEVWTDGKGETDTIVQEWTDSWKSLTDKTRTELTELKGAAEESGYTGMADQIQGDIDSLDAMDAEIGKLLKKRQNGYLTDDEKIRLEELIDERDAIIVKYKLQPDSETEGFQTIADKVEAEVARAQARGEKDADLSVYQNGMVAAAQGMAAINKEIDDQYDKQYALIQLMEDGEEKDQALAALNADYNARRLAAAQEYAQVLSQLVTPVWGSEEMQSTAGQLDDLAAKLTAYDAAVKTYGADSQQAASALEAVSNAAAGLDEGSLTEYAGVLTQISELLTSGMSLEDIQALFPDIDLSGALDQLASIQQFTTDYPDALSGLSSMFGEGLSEEVLTIATELDMTGAQSNWDEFAANPGAITTDAIIAGIQQDEEAERQQVLVDGVVSELVVSTENGKQLSVSGLIGYVTQYAESVTGADVSGLTPENVTAMVSAYQEMASGVDVSTLKPEEITAYISEYLEAAGVDTSGLSPDAITAFVLAYEEVTGGALTTSLKPDDITAFVVKYLEAEGVDLSALSPDQIEAIVSTFAEATGCDRSALAQSLTGYITSYDDSGATLPEPKVKLTIDGYDLTALQQFTEENPITVAGVARLGTQFDNPVDVLNADNVSYYLRGKKIPVELVPEEKLTADTIIAYDSDGTLHVLLMPEIGSPEEVQQSLTQMGEKTGGTGTVADDLKLFSSTSEDVQRINGLALGLSDLRQQIEDVKSADEGAQNLGLLSDLQTQEAQGVQDVQEALLSLSEVDLSNIGQTAAQLMAALANEDLDPETAQQYAEALKDIYDLVTLADTEGVLGEGNSVTTAIAEGMQAYDWSGDASTVADSMAAALEPYMPGIGSDASAGVGEGLSEYDFSGDTGAAAGNLEGAYRDAMASNSPAQRMVPLGQDVSAGVGLGMSQYSFAGDSSRTASSLMRSVSAALSAQTSGARSSAYTVGSSISSGIASGITGGRSRVVQAAVQVARAALEEIKRALQIRSPSRVFRDEVGLMAVEGISEGFLVGQREQARIIRNAARYLSGEAREGAIAGSTFTRQTVRQESSVNLTGNTFYIRNDQDVHDLAVEIASLTRTQQRGRGLRLGGAT